MLPIIFMMTFGLVTLHHFATIAKIRKVKARP